jgi:hypothetical protein
MQAVECGQHWHDSTLPDFQLRTWLKKFAGAISNELHVCYMQLIKFLVAGLIIVTY